MIGIFVGPSGSGKTYFIKNWLLPTLLTQPSQVTMLAPGRFKAALISDPISRRWPRGQYPGVRYRDVAAWNTSPTKSRLSCFDSATPKELCKLAMSTGDVILGFDEIDFAIPSRTVYRDGADGRAADPEFHILQRGRHEGIFLFGGCRRLHSINVLIRANLQIAWFANLTEPVDRDYASDMAQVPKAYLASIPRPKTINDPRYFLEWRKETDEAFLVHIVGNRRVARKLR